MEIVLLLLPKLRTFKSKFKTSLYEKFKIITMVFLICGLIYQVQIIYDQYMSGKTVVRLEIGQLSEETHPAITICTSLFSMEMAGKYHPGFTEINNLYQELMKNFSFDCGVLNKETSFKRHHYTAGNIKNNGLDMNELFDKMSIQYKGLDGKQTIFVYFIGKTGNDTLPGQWHVDIPDDPNSSNYYSYIGEPYQTITINAPEIKFETSGSLDKAKCYTYFTHAQ